MEGRGDIRRELGRIGEDIACSLLEGDDLLRRKDEIIGK